MLLYTTNITPRLQYIADFIGKEITGSAFLLTSSSEDFRNTTRPKINYSPERISIEEYWIKPQGLLKEKGITQQLINCFAWKDRKAFFKTEGDFGFDIFAASFYLLSRYEEYLPYEKDEYGRYAHTNSLAFKEGFLQTPLINYWISELRIQLENKFSGFKPQGSRFTFIPTYDIDEAFAYRHKQWWRSAGNALKNWLKGNKAELALRKNVLNGTVPDPYYTYTWMDSLHEAYKLHPLYFFLVAQRNKGYDKNILPTEPAMQQVIKEHAARYTTGVHPSWQSGDDMALLKTEKETIERIAGKPVLISRQHYIRLAMPDTFRRLINAGITADYSMGYGSINGFRASVASPFYWYDLEKEEQTPLLLYPFCFMDANSFYEKKQTAEHALEEMRWYYTEVKRVNGLLITLWHNNFFGSDKRFEGWKEVYESFVKEIAE